MSQRPKPSPARSVMNHIPFAVSSTLNLNDITTSPAHKRKLSPNISATPTNQDLKPSDAGSKSCKKIDLDADLVQQLFDEEPTFEGTLQ